MSPVSAARIAPDAVSAPPGGAVGSPALVPLPGQRFVPVGGSAPASPAAPGSAPQQGAQGAAAGGVDAEQGLKALQEKFGDQYGTPIVSPTGDVYMEQNRPELADGKLVLAFVKVARIDRATGRMFINEQFLQQTQQKQRDPNAKLVQVEGRFYYQSVAPGANGQKVAKLDPVPDDELEKLKQQAEAQQAQQAQEQWNQDRGQWISKLYTIGGVMRTVGFTGNVVSGLAQGPNPMTGKPGIGWYHGYMALQMLDSQAEGKLLPQFMKTGFFAELLSWADWGLMALSTVPDVQVLGQAFPRAASLMGAATAPVRAALRGVGALTGGNAASAATTAAQQAAGAAGAVGSAAGVAERTAAAAAGAAQATSAAAGATQATSAAAGAGAQAQLLSLGQGIRSGQVGVMESPNMVLKTAQGVQEVPKGIVQAAFKATEPQATGAAGTAMRIQNGINNGVQGALSALRPALRTLSIIGSTFGAVAGAMNVGMVVKNQGVKGLVDGKSGRSAWMGLGTSAAMLGSMLLPSVAGVAAPVMAAAGLASTVFFGLSLLNNSGLFGGGGYLDRDAVRAVFLIPPLSPIGLAAFWLKRREKRAVAEQQQLALRQQQAVQQIKQMRAQASEQIARTGAMPGAIASRDGTMLVPTNISNDLSGGSSKSSSLPDPSSDPRARAMMRPLR